MDIIGGAIAAVTAISLQPRGTTTSRHSRQRGMVSIVRDKFTVDETSLIYRNISASMHTFHWTAAKKPIVVANVRSENLNKS